MARLPDPKAGYQSFAEPMPPRMRMISRSLASAKLWPEWPIGMVLTWERGNRTWYQGISGKAIGGPPDAILDLRHDVNAGPILARLGAAGAAPNLHCDPVAGEWTMEVALAGRMLLVTGETLAMAAASALAQFYGLLTPEEAEAE